MIDYHYKRQSRLSPDGQAASRSAAKRWARFQLAGLASNLADKEISPSLARALREWYDGLLSLKGARFKASPGRVGTRFSTEARSKSAARVLAIRNGRRSVGSVWPRGHRANPGRK